MTSSHYTLDPLLLYSVCVNINDHIFATVRVYLLVQPTRERTFLLFSFSSLSKEKFLHQIIVLFLFLNFRSDIETNQFQFTLYIPKISARAKYVSTGVLILVQASGGGDYWGEYGKF